MPVTTFEAVIENGQVRLPVGVVVPERRTVFVVVPEDTTARVPRVPGTRLVDPEDAARFEMVVTWEEAP